SLEIHVERQPFGHIGIAVFDRLLRLDNIVRHGREWAVRPDINSITQISLLYDNDWVRAEEGADIQTGNNLIWNFASIHNVG
ncbi:hypothetical protein ACCS64_39215, partial [Rhizobium ruizarguesonis]